uniref:Uncharacterized protein n=1 Tax=Glossina austeni TaxID=7395 RepID=A0A1A9UJM9_GLOAU
MQIRQHFCPRKARDANRPLCTTNFCIIDAAEWPWNLHPFTSDIVLRFGANMSKYIRAAHGHSARFQLLQKTTNLTTSIFYLIYSPSLVATFASLKAKYGFRAEGTFVQFFRKRFNYVIEQYPAVVAAAAAAAAAVVVVNKLTKLLFLCLLSSCSRDDSKFPSFAASKRQLAPRRPSPQQLLSSRTQQTPLTNQEIDQSTNKIGTPRRQERQEQSCI